MQCNEYICRPDRGSRFCFITILFGRAAFLNAGTKSKVPNRAEAGVTKPLGTKGFTSLPENGGEIQSPDVIER